MTTENVAVLFTDVVSSTELSQRFSPEESDEVRRGHFSILRQALAETGGTEVKNLGDGLMVVFDSASAALACGVAMQQGVELDNRGRELAIGLRVGLSGPALCCLRERAGPCCERVAFDGRSPQPPPVPPLR
jgi:class 3 adenylate cyclase